MIFIGHLNKPRQNHINTKGIYIIVTCLGIVVSRFHWIFYAIDEGSENFFRVQLKIFSHPSFLTYEPLHVISNNVVF